MTALSSLIGGGFAGLPYMPNVPVDVTNINSGLTASTTAIYRNSDNLHPFIVRSDVLIDAVWWQRGNTNAANVYVGIYNATGTLLTDCAVDSDTTAGLHAVSTTPITLTAGYIYYFAINQSASVAINDAISGGDPEYSYLYSICAPALDRNMTATVLGATATVVSFGKARTAAALPATQTMNSWTEAAFKFMGGFVPV